MFFDLLWYQEYCILEIYLDISLRGCAIEFVAVVFELFALVVE